MEHNSYPKSNLSSICCAPHSVFLQAIIFNPAASLRTRSMKSLDFFKLTVINTSRIAELSPPAMSRLRQTLSLLSLSALFSRPIYHTRLFIFTAHQEHFKYSPHTCLLLTCFLILQTGLSSRTTLAQCSLYDSIVDPLHLHCEMYPYHLFTCITIVQSSTSMPVLCCRSSVYMPSDSVCLLQFH